MDELETRVRHELSARSLLKIVDELDPERDRQLIIRLIDLVYFHLDHVAGVQIQATAD